MLKRSKIKTIKNMFQRLKYVFTQLSLGMKALLIAVPLLLILGTGTAITLRDEKPNTTGSAQKPTSSQQQARNQSTAEQQTTEEATAAAKPDESKPGSSTTATPTSNKTGTSKSPSSPSSPSTPSTPNSPTTPTANCPNPAHTPGGSDGAGGCWPYAGNTGVPAGTTLTAYAGPCSIFSNTVIENKTVNCSLQMYGSSTLTIRNSVINGFIDNTNQAGALLIEDSEVRAGAWVGGGLWGSKITAKRVEITGGQHSVHCEAVCNISDSWLHDQYNPDGGSTHNNAFLSNGGANMTVTHNTLHCTAILNATGGGCTADLTLLGDFDTISYVTVDANLFMANNSSISYCAYGGYSPAKPYPNAHHVVFRNNIFQRGANSKCGVYGAITSFQASATGNVWTNNRWADGAVLNSVQ